MDTNRLPGAIIYTHSMLEGSMTFIKSHSEALTSFTPIYVGSHRVRGIPLPEDRTFAANDESILGLFREYLFRKFGHAPKLISRLKQSDPRIVHAHFGDCGPAAMTIAGQLNIPFVVTFHGQDATRSDSEAAKTLRGRELLKNKDRMVSRAGLFIAVSNHIQRCLLNRGYPESKIVVHRNGINVEFFKPDRSVSRQPVVLFVGRFVEKKGVRYLIEAAQLLKEENVDFELVLVGSGPLGESLEAMAKRSNLPCRFVGFLDVENVKKWIAKASVVAVPSVTAADGDSEGLPTVLLEAQAMETPVVATRHSGIPEGVREGISAELVSERESIPLARELKSFLTSPEKVRNFGEAGRRFILDNFDIRTQAKGLEEIYCEVISRARTDNK